MCYIFFKGVFVEMDNHELTLQQASQKLKYGNEVLTVEGSYRGSCSFPHNIWRVLLRRGRCRQASCIHQQPSYGVAKLLRARHNLVLALAPIPG